MKAELRVLYVPLGSNVEAITSFAIPDGWEVVSIQSVIASRDKPLLAVYCVRYDLDS